MFNISKKTDLLSNLAKALKEVYKLTLKGVFQFEE